MNKFLLNINTSANQQPLVSFSGLIHRLTKEGKQFVESIFQKLNNERNELTKC